MVFKFFTNTVNDSTNAQYQFEFGATTAHFAALNKSMRKGVIQYWSIYQGCNAPKFGN